MNKKDIELGEELYYNTTGAFRTLISMKCKVIDIGELWIWVHIKNNLSYNNVLAEELSIKPLYKVTNG